MAYKNIQYDYGAFDYKFLGVSLNFDFWYSDNWNYFRRAYGNNDPLIKNEIRDLIDDGNKEKAFEILSISTVWEHEIRHFHDFLLSPFWGCVMRLESSALINALQIFLKISNGVIPVPYSKWKFIKQDYKEEADIDLVAMKKMHNNLIEIPNDLLPNLEVVEKYYNLIDNQVNDGINKNLSATSLLEASAIIIQLQSTFMTHGDKNAEFYMNELFHEIKSSYSIIIRTLYEIVPRDNDFVYLKMINAIITWCIMGDDDIESPVARFIKICGAIDRDNSIINYNTDINNLYDLWTYRCNVTPIHELLKRNIDKNIKHYQKLLEIQEDVYFKNPFFDVVIKNFKQYVNASQYMCHKFIEDYEEYISPEAYMKNIDKYVKPISKAYFNNGGILLRSDKDAAMFDKIEEYKLNEFGEKIVRKATIKFDVGYDILNPDLCFKAYDASLICDLLFNQYVRRDRDDLITISDFLSEKGIIPFEVF